MINDGIRGGYSGISRPYAEANNPDLKTKEFDPNKQRSYIMMWDITNQYGRCMMNSLPTHDFRWVEDLTIFTPEYIMNHSPDDETGYFIEVV